MAQWVDYYSILQVHQQVEADVLESTYKKLCKKYHPDVNPSAESEARMKQINEAYEVLKDGQRREAYYQEWQKRSRVAPRQSAFIAHTQAHRILNQYFACLSGRLLEDAYALLSVEDKRRIALRDFVRWQASVTEAYQLLDFQLEPSSKRFSDFLLDSGRSCQAERFTVQIQEKDLQTGETASYALNKFVICDAGVYGVYLGYRDLRAFSESAYDINTVREDRALAQWGFRAAAALPGVPNFHAFLEDVKAEMDRYHRYKRSFVLGVIKAGVTVTPRPELRDQIVALAAYTLKKLLRTSDCLAYIAENHFGILLVETKFGAAKKVTERLARRLDREISYSFDTRVSCRYGLSEYSGEPAIKAMDACVRMIRGGSL